MRVDNIESVFNSKLPRHEHQPRVTILYIILCIFIIIVYRSSGSVCVREIRQTMEYGVYNFLLWFYFITPALDTIDHKHNS